MRTFSLNVLRVLRTMRISYLHFNSLIFFLSFYATHSEFTWHLLFPCLGMLVGYHLYNCWSNDLPGLEIDKTDPERVWHFLVAGLISKRNFSILTFGLIPLLFFCTYWVNASYFCCAGNIFFMTVYNYYGKSWKIPPLSDACQGLSWVFYVYWVASINGAAANFECLVLALFFSVFITLINGIHASLRDLKIDWKNKIITTPIFFGICGKEGQLRMTLSMRIYSIISHLVIFAIPFLIPLYRITSTQFSLVVFLLSIVSVVNYIGLIFILRKPDHIFLVRLHGILLLIPIFVAFVPYLPGSSLLVTFYATVIPLLLTGCGTFIKSRLKQNAKDLSLAPNIQ